MLWSSHIHSNPHSKVPTPCLQSYGWSLLLQQRRGKATYELFKYILGKKSSWAGVYMRYTFIARERNGWKKPSRVIGAGGCYERVIQLCNTSQKQRFELNDSLDVSVFTALYFKAITARHPRKKSYLSLDFDHHPVLRLDDLVDVREHLITWKHKELLQSV